MKYSNIKSDERISPAQYPLASMRPAQLGMCKEKGHLSIIFTTFLPEGSIKFRTYIQEILHRKPARVKFIFSHQRA
ncbi:MAG: hypothetical protein C0490_14085 [Marivirga sp.]|nr:hypothetical protein [Marivirga sp.]